MTAVLLGTITGIGGSILRDVMAGITPAVLRPDARLYAIPAVTGCTLVAMAQEAGVGGSAAQITTAAGICGIRLLALWRGWLAGAGRPHLPARPNPSNPRTGIQVLPGW